MARSKVKTARKLIANPMVQRAIIWLAPIVFRYVVKQLRGRKSSGATGRKYVRNKAK